MNDFFARHQPQQSFRGAVTAGLGGIAAIALTGALTAYGHVPLLMAPFGASCVLLFSAPASPFSQPVNVVGGHFLATAIGLAMRLFFPDLWWSVAVAVGIAIGLMAVLRMTHPPAGADPIVVFAGDPGFGFLVFPVLAGSLMLVVVATLFHRFNGISYPIRKERCRA